MTKPQNENQPGRDINQTPIIILDSIGYALLALLVAVITVATVRIYLPCRDSNPKYTIKF